MMKTIQATLALLVVGSVAFAAHPSVSTYVSAQAALDASQTTHLDVHANSVGDPAPVPLCACPIEPTTQVFHKDYSAGWNASCAAHPAIPNKYGQATHTKYICNNGGYWTCEYYEAGCTSITDPKPACPNDTCRSF